ncbi:KLTH0E12386p [Lachancea thermotolerans CBS 6340]|uniref:KLTH0E12386p n=1 Tax=Lachancea thermotolerans (strain ATCC 56472 / CBS 6340 / NRRL Y-8284) TaxID=559295 RepID=C5DIG7_LACTC|nr:KLTH0E12386p [Lachancea thermotolerans CBS 6340]CAR23578.1 KLTH0E12386p [Lachancea thermotolerans CBS 6340]
MELRRSSRRKAAGQDSKQDPAQEPGHTGERAPDREPARRSAHEQEQKLGRQQSQAPPAAAARKRRKPLRKDAPRRLARPAFLSLPQPHSSLDSDAVRACGKKSAELVAIQDHPLARDPALQRLTQQVQQLSESLQSLQSLQEPQRSEDEELLPRIRQELGNGNRDLVLARALTDPNISESQSLKLVAKWYGIDMRDVCDIAFLRDKPGADRNSRQRSELQFVNKRISRALLQERDTSLPWPEKRRKTDTSQPTEASSSGDAGDRFQNVTLLS